MQQVRDWLRGAPSVAVLTGAGISAESGIPTFRSANGLWREYRPEDLATPQALQRDPHLVWEWYQWRRALIARAWREAEDAMRSAAVLLVVGTSGVVYPAAQLVSIARTAGARVVEINVEDTAQSGYCDAVLRGRSGDLLPQLIA